MTPPSVAVGVIIMINRRFRFCLFSLLSFFVIFVLPTLSKYGGQMYDFFFE